MSGSGQATQLLFSGPSGSGAGSALPGNPVTGSIGVNGLLAQSTAVTLSDGGAGGSFVPSATVTLTQAAGFSAYWNYTVPAHATPGTVINLIATAAGLTPATTTVTVLTPQTASVIAVPAVASVAGGSPVSISLEANGPNTNSFTLNLVDTIGSQPGGGTFSSSAIQLTSANSFSASFTYTPAPAAANETVTITPTGPAYVSAQPITINVLYGGGSSSGTSSGSTTGIGSSSTTTVAITYPNALDLEIANDALSRLSEQAIASFGDNSRQARMVSRLYPRARALTFSGMDWGFARSRYLLGGQTTGVYPWAYQYTMPPNVAKVRYVAMGQTAPDGRQLPPMPYEEGVSADESSRVIWCDANPAVLVYTQEVLNNAIWSSGFIACLTWQLAAELAFPVTGNGALAQEMAQAAQRALGTQDPGQAMAIMQQQRGPSTTTEARR